MITPNMRDVCALGIGCASPKMLLLKKTRLHKAHDSHVAKHSKYVNILNALRMNYLWLILECDILHYVREHLSCQRIKAKRFEMPRRLQPLNFPQMK